MSDRRTSAGEVTAGSWQRLLGERGLVGMAPEESDALRSRYEALRAAADEMRSGAKHAEPLFVLPLACREGR